MSQNLLINNDEIDPLEILDNEYSHKNPLSDVDRLRLTRYVYNPGREIDVSRKRNMNMRKVFRMRLTPVRTWTPIQESPRRYEENGNISHEPIPIFAGWLSDQLCDTYARPYCVIEIPEFIGWKEAIVTKIQKILIPNYPNTIMQMVDLLEQALVNIEQPAIFALEEEANQEDIASTIRSAFDKMLEATKQAWIIYSEQLDTAIMERKNHDTTGKKFFDKADMEIARLLGREDELTAKASTITEEIKELATAIRQPAQPQAVTQQPVASEPPRAKKRCKHCANDIWLEAVYCQYCHKQVPANPE